MILEAGTKRQFKRCVLDTVCTYVYHCGHVYVPGAVALDVLNYRPGEAVPLANTECDECKLAKQEALYHILMNAQWTNAHRNSQQARIEAERARAVPPASLYVLPEEMARIRGAGQYTCSGVDMSTVQSSWSVCGVALHLA